MDQEATVETAFRFFTGMHRIGELLPAVPSITYTERRYLTASGSGEVPLWREVPEETGGFGGPRAGSRTG